MHIIAVANEKGGVGKTTVTVTVAAGLAKRGKRVLMIDADPQGHATAALGIAKYPGLYDLLVRDADFRQVIKAVPSDKYDGDGKSKLYIIGGNVETRHIANSISDAWALAHKLALLAPTFEYCLIDTSPTPSLLHAALYMAAQHVIYPTLAEFWSFDGLAASIDRQRNTAAYNNLAIAGIVPVRVRAHTLEHAENLRALRAQFGALVWEPIPDSIIWAEAATYQLPVFAYAPDHSASESAWGLVDRVEAINASTG
jgi:chromosome partitioning protein